MKIHTRKSLGVYGLFIALKKAYKSSFALNPTKEEIHHWKEQHQLEKYLKTETKQNMLIKKTSLMETTPPALDNHEEQKELYRSSRAQLMAKKIPRFLFHSKLFYLTRRTDIIWQWTTWNAMILVKMNTLLKCQVRVGFLKEKPLIDLWMEENCL